MISMATPPRPHLMQHIERLGLTDLHTKLVSSYMYMAIIITDWTTDRLLYKEFTPDSYQQQAEQETARLK